MICWFLMEARITATSRESPNSWSTPPAQYDGGILERRKQNGLWTRRRSCSKRGMGVGVLLNELLLRLGNGVQVAVRGDGSRVSWNCTSKIA
jgi:hypothetical protein